MSKNKTHIDLHPRAAPFLLPPSIKLTLNIDEAMLRRLLTLPPGESVGLGQPYAFDGNPPELGQAYEITVGSPAGDFAVAASVTGVVGDHEVQLIATRRGADVPSDYQVTLEQLDFDKERPWLWATILRLPILTAGQAFDEGPEEEEGDGDGGDDELEEDDDEFRDPNDVADAYEEMKRRHEDHWLEEGEGDSAPSWSDPMLELAQANGGAS